MSTTANRLDPSKRAELLLLPLLAVILVGALIAPWHTVATVDERTYLEMTEAVSRTGLPRFSNGPVERFPELQARWNLADGDRIWGAMAPGMSYLFAPAFRIGGIGLLLQINIALIAVTALGVYDLGRRVTRDPLLGVASAYVAIVAIPVWSSSFFLTPYSVAIATSVWSVATAARSLDTPTQSGRWTVASGLLAGMAALCHLLVLPVALSMGLIYLWKRPRLFFGYAGAAAPFAVAAALLNRLRFGSWNPVTDGPCVWKGCPESGIDPQSVGQMLTFGAPFIGLLLGSCVAAFLLRRRPWMSFLMVAGGGAIALTVPGVREPAQRYALLTWAFLADPNVLALGEEFRPTNDGLGVFVGPHVVKGLLQCSPFLVLALWGGSRVKHRELLVIPVLAQLAMLVLRANMPWDLAIGHSFLSLRYLMPVAPLLAVLAIAATRDLDWNLQWIALATVIAAILRWILSGPVDDFDPLRRRFLLHVTLLIAGCLLIVSGFALRTARKGWTRATLALSSVALGISVGATMGVDFTATARFRTKNDVEVEMTQRSLPSRFALVGYPDQLDAILSLLPSRDIEYLDLLEVSDPMTVRDLTLYWEDQQRPVYLRVPPDPEFSLAPGLEADVVDPMTGLLLLRSAPLNPSQPPI